MRAVAISADDHSAPARDSLRRHLDAAGYRVLESSGPLRDQIDTLREAEAMIVLLGPTTGESRRVRAQVGIARARHTPIIPVLIAGRTIPALFQSLAVIDARPPAPGLDALFARLAAIPAPGPEPIPPVPPGILLMTAAIVVIGGVLGLRILL